MEQGKRGGEGNILRRTAIAYQEVQEQEPDRAILTALLLSSLNSGKDTYTTSHMQSPLCILKHSWPYTMSPTSGPLHSSVLTVSQV